MRSAYSDEQYAGGQELCILMGTSRNLGLYGQPTRVSSIQGGRFQISGYLVIILLWQAMLPIQISY